MKGSRQELALACRDDGPIRQTGEYLDTLADRLDLWRTDKDAGQRPRTEGRGVKGQFKTSKLATVSVAAHRNVHTAHRGLAALLLVKDGAREENGPGAGSPDSQIASSPRPQRLKHAIQGQKPPDGGALAPRNDQVRDGSKLGRQPHLKGVGAKSAEDCAMFAEITLEGEDANCHGNHRRAVRAR